MLPAAAVVDRLAPPDAGGAVEVEEAAAAIAAAVLEHEVRVEQHRLDLGEQRIVFVDVPPARLHERDLGIGEVMNGAGQEVGLRNEVGIEDRDVGAARDLQSLVQRAGLEAGAILAMDVLDVDALQRMPPHGELGDLPGLVGRVVQHLDLEPLARVLDLTDRVDQPIDHVHFVVERQLDGDHGQLVERGLRLRLLVFVFHVDVHQVVPVPSVNGEDEEDEEVRGEDQCFDGSHLRWALRQ